MHSGQQFSGVPSGKPRKQHAYARDERLTRARALLQDEPEASTAEAVARLAADDATATSSRSWTQIVRTARRHPTA